MSEKSDNISSNDCPICGMKMEHGYIVSGVSLSWCNHVPTALCSCNEILAKSFWRCASLEGFRCKKCQIFRYITK